MPIRLMPGTSPQRLFCMVLLFSLSVGSGWAQNEERRQAFLSLLGEMPSRQGVAVEVVETITDGECVRRRLRYELAGEPIESYLLIPRGIEGKAPGILAIHQDGSHRPYEFGKGEPAGVHGDPELQYGRELCRRGYVVICPDRFGFESRMLSRSRFNDTFRSFPITVTFEEGGEVKTTDLTEDLYRGAMGASHLVRGRTMLGMTVAELMFAVDYLSALDGVDSDRLGVIGHSAGGFLAAVMMYVDDRLEAGCSSCGTLTLDMIYGADRLRPMNGFCGLLAVPGIRIWGDFDDVLAGLYPRPFLETSADVTREANYGKAFDRYSKGGHRNRIEHVFYEAGAHIFRKDMREASYEWLDRWLR
jgi:dienelactone hydrolase